MTTYCHVSNNFVDQRTFFDGEMPADWPDRADWIADEDAQIGWSYANGEFTAPALPPPSQLIPPLEPWRFRAVVRLAFPPPAGGDDLDGLRALITTAITDPVQQAVALARLAAPPGGMYSIDDPLFSNAELMAATGKTEADIQAMWTQGLGLSA